MSLTEMKKNLDEVIERECKQGTKTALKGLCCSCGLGLLLYLYGQCVLETGRQLGRIDILSMLRKAVNEVEVASINEDNKN